MSKDDTSKILWWPAAMATQSFPLGVEDAGIGRGNVEGDVGLGGPVVLKDVP